MSSKYSSTVYFLCQQCDGWIIGSAADPENDNPRDIDIIVPFSKWHTALGALPQDRSKIEVNTFGGYKFEDDDGVEIDMWPGELTTVLTSYVAQYLYHPWYGIRYKRDTSDG